MVSSLHFMKTHVEATLLQRELLTKFCRQDTIGLPFTKILEDTPVGVLVPKDGETQKKDEMPLHPQVALEAFYKWGMNFFGPIDPPSGQNKYIIVCNDYLKKWAEEK